MNPNSMNQVEIVCSWVFRDEHSMLRSSWHFYGFPLHKTLAAAFQCSFYSNIKIGGIFMASGRVARTSFASQTEPVEQWLQDTVLSNPLIDPTQL